MEDQEINEKLAEIMGAEWSVFRQGVRTMYRCGMLLDFDYKDHSIFAENVIWLRQAGWVMGRYENNCKWTKVIYKNDVPVDSVSIMNKSDYKAVALARIAAEGKAND